MKARQLEGNKKGALITNSGCGRNHQQAREPKTTTRKELAKIAGVFEYAISTTRKILKDGTNEQKDEGKATGKRETAGRLYKQKRTKSSSFGRTKNNNKKRTGKRPQL